MSGLNIAPRNVFEGTNSDGSRFRVNEYDFNTHAGLETGKFLTLFIAFGVIAPFVSIILLMVGIWNFRGRFQLAYPLCIALSGYFLFDAYKGWLVLSFTQLVLDENQINWLLGINCGIILYNVFIWAFGEEVAKIIHQMDVLVFRWLTILLIIGAWMTFGCYQLNQITARNPHWVHKNLEIGNYVPEGSYRLKFK